MTQRSALGDVIAGAFTGPSGFPSGVAPAYQPIAPIADEEADPSADLRAALAVRGWVNPRELMPPVIDDTIRVRTLNAVAPDVETSFRQYPGKWYLAAPVRRRVIAASPRATLLAELERLRHADDANDPVRRAFRKLLKLEPLDMEQCSLEELRAIESAGDWLGEQQPDAATIRDQAVALGARRKREAEIARLTAGTLIGREQPLQTLKAFLSAPFDVNARLSATYIYGIGGSGKSTVLAHLEKAMVADAQPLLVHFDFDRVDLDSADAVSLDLVLLQQLSVAIPQKAARCRELAVQLAAFRSRLRADKSETQTSPGRRPARKRKVVKQETHTLDLESAQSREGSERDSILYHYLDPVSGLQSAQIDGHVRPLLLILDTLEVVFARGAAAVGDLVKWLDSLTGVAAARDVRVVLAGRDPLPEDKNRDIYARLVDRGHLIRAPIPLADLDEDQAVALLTEADVSAPAARAAAKALPGNPLVLRIAAEIFTKSPESLDEIQREHAAGRIDRMTASRYLAQRVIAHLPDRVAQPYALAAIALPQVTEELIREVVLPAVDDPDAGQDRRKAKRVYDAFAATGWLVVPAFDGKSFTYHRELRALVQKFIQADPDGTRTQEKVRAAAINWHRTRRSRQDQAFGLYHRLMLGGAAIRPDERDLAPLLAPFLDDLPERARKALTEDGFEYSESLLSPARPSDAEWRAYLEGVGQRPGQGEKLVRRGRTAEVLDLYRSRPTRAKGVPPTFLIQALADNAEWHTDEVDLEHVLDELDEALPAPGRRFGGNFLSRIYWLTRYEMLRHPEALSPRHIRLLRVVTRALTPGSYLLAMSSLIATAEAFSGERLAPQGWIEHKRAIATDTRLHLVHALRFGASFIARANLDALVVTQRKWGVTVQRLCKDTGEKGAPLPDRGFTLPLAMIKDAESRLPSLHLAPYPQVSKLMRELRRPITIDYGGHDSAAAIVLLRGMTIEFHRPLKSALAASYRELKDHPRAKFAPIWRAIKKTLQKMTIHPRELDADVLWELIAADPTEWFGAFVSYTDRSGLLPALCGQLARAAGRTAAQRRLKRAAAAFEAWDRALRGPPRSRTLIKSTKQRARVSRRSAPPKARRSAKPRARAR